MLGGPYLLYVLETLPSLTQVASSTCLALPSLIYGIPSGQFSSGSWSVLRESPLWPYLTGISRDLCNL